MRFYNPKGIILSSPMNVEYFHKVADLRFKGVKVAIFMNKVVICGK